MFYFGLKNSCAFQVYVLKRPHVDEFLKRMGELFECVLFTASLAKVRNYILCVKNSVKSHFYSFTF